ncbi:MAG TPA: hypothetical protein VGK89_05440 [Candidatus Eisenbacteria bacterium]
MKRHPGAPSEGVARPDWLTRSNDHTEATPGAGARPPQRPQPAAPAHAPAPGPRPDPARPPASADPQWTPPPGGVPRLETDSVLSAHIPSPRTGSRPEPRPDDRSWERAVAQVARTPSSARAGPGSAPRGNSGLLALVTKPGVLVVLAVAAIAAAVITLRPRGEGDTVSIGAIRHHPERFDGQAVKLKGRVGEVFMVGGGYAFYLHQGRDTMVVFTRSRIPVRSEEVTISGSISNGILDGVSRQALFETASH